MKQPNETLELAPREAGEIARPQAQGLTIERMYEAVRSGEITADKLAVMKDLLKMDAERQFADALAQVQAELPLIEATSIIPNRGKYAKFEHIMAQIQPVLSRHHFSVSFRQSIADNRIVETCTLKHRAGHFTETPFAVRPGGKSDSETQADCKASTTARRNSLVRALNIVVTQDCLIDGSDAHNEGEFIGPADALDLQRRVFETGSDVLAFLNFAGVVLPATATADQIKAAFGRIGANKLPALEAALRKKESTK